MRGDRERILDVLEAIEKIEKYAAKGPAVFFEQELIQVWIVHHIQIIGEATARISEPTRRRRSDIPWPDIVAMRNILVHQYFGINLQQVWDTVVRDLPTLKKKLTELLAEL